jgi:hypothetical protein
MDQPVAPAAVPKIDVQSSACEHVCAAILKPDAGRPAAFLSSQPEPAEPRTPAVPSGLKISWRVQATQVRLWRWLRMQIFDLTCDTCGATYDVAESATLDGEPTEFSCRVCGHAMTRLDAHRYRVCRMIVPAERALFHIPPNR